MKPDLISSFSPEWDGYPPAMPTGDYGIWLKYRKKLIGAYDKIYFNVRIGEPIIFPEDLEPEMQAMTIALSRRRIDVVAENLNGWLLIELKYLAGTEALGQILMYRALWLLDPPDSRPVNLAIVSNVLNKDLLSACKAYDVNLLQV